MYRQVGKAGRGGPGGDCTAHPRGVGSEGTEIQGGIMLFHHFVLNGLLSSYKLASLWFARWAESHLTCPLCRQPMWEPPSPLTPPLSPPQAPTTGGVNENSGQHQNNVGDNGNDQIRAASARLSAGPL